MKRILIGLFIIVAIIDRTKTAQYIVTDEVYFDIMIGDRPAGRMTIGLFGDTVPKTVKNFMTIASTGINGKTYAGTPFHRVIKKFMVQGGDIVNGDGTGSVSVYGEHFEDENFDISHSAPGFISMANSGKDTNGCQFFITTLSTPWLDGQHVIFGKVVDGMDVLFKIEQTKTDTDDRPIKRVIVHECGIVPLKSSYTISDNPYDLWGWFKATAVPLSFSFSILAFFHWMMKQLDMAC